MAIRPIKNNRGEFTKYIHGIRRRRCAVLLVSVVLLGFFSSCSSALGIGYKKEGYEIPLTDIHIFQNTAAWELAVAVEKQDLHTIEMIATESPDILDIQEPLYDTTLLIWAVGMGKYNAAETLLKCGANPNIIADCTEKFEEEKAVLQRDGVKPGYGPDFTPGLILGETALYIASRFLWVERIVNEDPKFVNLLLEYGADPNICYIGAETFTMPGGSFYSYSWDPGRSPLMQSIGASIEKTKALVEGGRISITKQKAGKQRQLLPYHTVVEMSQQSLGSMLII